MITTWRPAWPRPTSRNTAARSARALDLLLNHDAADDEAKAIIRQIRAETGATPTLKPNKEFDDALRERLTAMTDEATVERMLHYATERGYRETERRTYQAMEAFIHNLNTMHSRAGAQTPFSSINYGMDTSPEGAHGDAQPAAGDGEPAWATAKRRFSPFRFSASRRA